MYISRIRTCFGFILVGLVAAFMIGIILLRTDATPPVTQYTLSPSERHMKRLSSLALYKRSGFAGYEHFFDYIENPAEHACSNKREFGGAILEWTSFWTFLTMSPISYIDGNKMVCLEKELFEGKDCLVISIGIGNDWSFDEDISSYGCQVFAFDHTIYEREHTRERRLHFYPYGIGEQNRVTEKGRLITLSLMIDLIKARIKRKEIIINYLKIDVEGSELEFFEYILHRVPKMLNIIQQIGMEIHPRRIDNNNAIDIYKKYFDYFMELEDKNFTLFHSEMNTTPGNCYYFSPLRKYINGYYELVWRKLG